MTIMAMTFGELVSFIFAIISYFKINRPRYLINSNDNPQKELLKISIPTTSSKLVGSLTYFLEPILYTTALTLIGYSATKIGYLYSEYSAYAEGLLTMFSFISASIAVSIVPHISESFALKDFKISFYIKNPAMSILPRFIYNFTSFLFKRIYVISL